MSFSFPQSFLTLAFSATVTDYQEETWFLQLGSNVHPVGLQLHGLDVVIQPYPFSRGSRNHFQRRGHGQVGTVVSEPGQLQRESSISLESWPLAWCIYRQILRYGVSSEMSPLCEGFKMCSEKKEREKKKMCSVNLGSYRRVRSNLELTQREISSKSLGIGVIYWAKVSVIL